MSDREGQRVVLVHRYFYPDTPPYANMLRSIATALAKDGYEVHVLTCQPSYDRTAVRSAARREDIDGVHVVRWPVLDDRRSLWLKVVNLFWFSARLVLAREFRGAAVVMAATTPPVAIAALCARIAQLRGAEFVYHKQDVWPEVSGPTSSRFKAMAYKLLRRIDSRTEAMSSQVVVLSEDMAQTVAARAPTPPPTSVINNFDPWDHSHYADLDSPPGPLRVVFAGGLGRFQGLERVADLVVATAADEIEWHFFGDGPLRVRLAAASEKVTMHGYQPADQVARFIEESAHLGLVSLNPEVIRSAYPSKTMTYLRLGCPILALVESDSELAQMVTSEQIGAIGDLADVGAVVEVLRELSYAPEKLAPARRRAAEVYRNRFARDGQLARWVSLFRQVIE